MLAGFESSASGSILTSSAGDFNGGLVDAQFDADVLTSLYVTWESAGHSHPFYYVPSGATGSASAIDFTALESLVTANLDGPAKDAVLNAFHTAQSQYNTLAVPEPGSWLLVAAAFASFPVIRMRRAASGSVCRKMYASRSARGISSRGAR